MSNYTGKKKDTVITDGSGQEKDIAPVQSDYGSKWGSAGTGASGNGKTSYGSSWLGKAISGFGGRLSNMVSNYTGKNGGSANGNGSGLVKTRYAAGGTEPKKGEDGGGAEPERLSDDLSGGGTGGSEGGTGEGISSGGEGGGNGDTGGSNYTGTNTTYEPSIEQKRQSAYTEAEKERQRAIVDVHNAYETNKSNYGANAEALGAMGLTGSGYSDYMNSSAYATARGEVQKANAQSAYTKRVADETAAKEQSAYVSARTDKFNAIVSNIGSYDTEQINALVKENGFTEEQAAALTAARSEWETEQRNANYNDVLKGAKDGTYNFTQVEGYIKQYGFDEEQAGTLRGIFTNEAGEVVENNVAVDTTTTDYQAKYSTFYTNAQSAGSANDIRAMGNSAGLTEADINTVITSVQNNNYSYYLPMVTTSDCVDEIDGLYAQGLISEPHYTELKKKYSDSFDVTSARFLTTGADGSTSWLSKEMAKALVDEAKASSWLSTDKKTAIENQYKSLYSVDIITVTPTWDGANPDISDGNNFKITYNNKEYKVQCKTDVDAIVTAAALDVSNGKFFKYNGEIYYKIDGVVYGVEKRHMHTDDPEADKGENYAAFKSELDKPATNPTQKKQPSVANKSYLTPGKIGYLFN